MSLDKYVLKWNDNFEFDLVKPSQLKQTERAIFELKDLIMSRFPYAKKKVKSVVISNVMRPDS